MLLIQHKLITTLLQSYFEGFYQLEYYATVRVWYTVFLFFLKKIALARDKERIVSIFIMLKNRNYGLDFDFFNKKLDVSLVSSDVDIY